MNPIAKPQAGEYTPYAIMYIDLVPENAALVDFLEDGLRQISAAVQGLSDAALGTPCAEGEWTIKEILIHILDNERIFAYRALRIARGDTTPLPGYEQDDYVPESNANQRTIESILEEYAAVRAATVTLIKSLDEDAYTRRGIASHHALSVRAALYIIAGHERHHLESIHQNYLNTET